MSRKLIAALGAGGLIYLILSWPGEQLGPLLVRLGPTLPWLLGLALATLAVYSRSLAVFLPGLGWGRLLYNRLLGDAWAALTPLGGLGGEPIKLVDLGAQVGAGRAVRAMVLDRLAYAAGGLVFSGLAALVAIGRYRWDARLEHGLLGYGAAAALAAAALTVVAVRPATGRWAAEGVRRIRRRLSGGRSALAAPAGDRAEDPAPAPLAAFLRALLWNVLGRVASLIEIAILLHALGHEVRPEALLAIGALLAMTGYLFFFVPGGVGVAEAAAVLALSLTGHGEAAGLAVGLARRMRSLLMAGAGLALQTLWPPGQRPARPLPTADLDATTGGLP